MVPPNLLDGGDTFLRRALQFLGCARISRSVAFRGRLASDLTFGIDPAQPRAVFSGLAAFDGCIGAPAIGLLGDRA